MKWISTWYANICELLTCATRVLNKERLNKLQDIANASPEYKPYFIFASTNVFSRQIVKRVMLWTIFSDSLLAENLRVEGTVDFQKGATPVLMLELIGTVQQSVVNSPTNKKVRSSWSNIIVIRIQLT